MEQFRAAEPEQDEQVEVQQPERPPEAALHERDRLARELFPHRCDAESEDRWSDGGARGNVAGWVGNPQAIKPGNKMPPHDLNDDDLRAVAEYLRSLR